MERGHGHRPTLARLRASISTNTMSPLGARVVPANLSSASLPSAGDHRPRRLVAATARTTARARNEEAFLLQAADFRPTWLTLVNLVVLAVATALSTALAVVSLAVVAFAAVPVSVAAVSAAVPAAVSVA